MFDYQAAHFEALCRAERVREPLATLEQSRREAVRNFWIYLLGGLALAGAIAWSLIAADWPTVAAILAAIVIIVALVLAIRPLTHVSRGLKHPVLEELARAGGMEYLPTGFEPPVFPHAQRVLFGGLSSRTFTDLFHGSDESGRRFAVYEATLTRRQGKNTVTVFSGQIYAWQRRSAGSGETAILADKGWFNFIKPKGMERVRFDSDPDFEKKYEVYSTQPPSALGLVGSDVRRTLLDLRAKGRVSVYIGAEDVLVALWGKNRFETGSMFSSRPGPERVRSMFDDLCASLAVLRELRARLL